MNEKTNDVLREFFKRNNWKYFEPNPSPWDPTEPLPEVQVGFEKEIKEIENYINSGTGILAVTGQPGEGKTQLTLVVKKKLDEDEYVIPVYYERPPLDEKNFVFGIASALFEYKILKKPFVKFLTPTNDYIGAYTFSRLKEEIKKNIGDKYKIVLFCDEAHTGDPALSLHLFKTLSDDKSLHVKLIFSGYESRGVSLSELLGKTYSDRITKDIRMPGLSVEQLKQMVIDRLKFRCGHEASIDVFKNILEAACRDAGMRPRKALKLK